MGPFARCVRNRASVFVLTVIALQLGCGAISAAAAEGTRNSLANAVNARGQVVGFSYTESGHIHAFVWDNGVMRDLGTLDQGTVSDSLSNALAINDQGQIAGYSTVSTGFFHAFLFDKGVMKDLGTLGGDASVASAVNESGQVVGWSLTAAGVMHPFLWDRGVMIDLASSGNASNEGEAIGINNRGQVIGQLGGQGFVWNRGVLTKISGAPAAINERGQVVGGTQSGSAFSWLNGVLTDLGPGYAVDVNAAGQVVGVSNSGVTSRAVIWDNGRVIEVPGLAGPGSFAQPTNINDRGQVTGWSNPPGPSCSHAFLFDHGVSADLGSLVPGGCSIAGSNNLTGALNNAGSVVGDASAPKDTDRAFLWRGGVMIDLGSL
jgi:probable HAF family extracellular repeat protein